MTSFDDRERGYENKFAHDADLKFQAEMRRNRILGLWAAAQLGKTGDAAELYVKDIVRADFAEPGSDDVVRKLMDDLSGKADEATIRQKLADADAEAHDAVTT